MADAISVTSLALALVGKTTEALNALREHAKRTKDLDIKDQINTMYDHVLDLKEAISRLVDENNALKRKLEHETEKPVLRPFGDTVYCFQSNNPNPCCPNCYSDKGKLIPLSSPQDWNGGVRRECTLCGEQFYERRMNVGGPPVRLGGRYR